MKASWACALLVLCVDGAIGCGGELTDRGDQPDAGAKDDGVVDGSVITGPLPDASHLPDTSSVPPTQVDSSVPSPPEDAGGPVTVPPSPPPNAPPTMDTTAHNYALHHVHLGDEIDPVYGTAGWKAYGYNIDGLDTTATSTNVCTPNPTASNTRDQVDGPGGIDNSFGANIVGPLLALLVSNPSQTVDDSLAAGNFTFLIDVTGVNGVPNQTASGLSGAVFNGLSFGGVPTFTPADNWPISTASVTSSVGAGGVLAQPIVAVVNLQAPYVVDGTFVSGTPQLVTLDLTIGDYQLVLPIERAQITFQSSGSPAGLHAGGGIISGVINTEQFLTALGTIAASNNLCSEIPALVPAVTQASDILDDGTNVPGTPCTAISVGIGFDADEIAQPTIAQPPPAPPPDCSTGG